MSISQIQAFVHPYHEGKAPNPAGSVLASFNWANPVFMDSPETLHSVLCGDKRACIFGEWDYEEWVVAGRVGTPRKRQYFVRSNVLVYDFDNGFPDVSNLSPVEAWELLVERLTTNPLIRDCAYLVIPSSGFTPAVHADNPEGGSLLKHHIIFKLDDWITDWDEYKRLWWAFACAVGFEFVADDATQHPAQPLYGTKFYRIPDETQLEGYSSEKELSLAYVRSLAQPADEKRPTIARRKVYTPSSSDEYAVMSLPADERVKACVEFIQAQPQHVENKRWFVILKAVRQASDGDERARQALEDWFPAWDDDSRWDSDSTIIEPSESINPNNILVPYLQAHPELAGYVKGLGSYLDATHFNREIDVQTGNIELFRTQINIGAMGTSKTDYIPKIAQLMQPDDVILVLSHRISLTDALKGSLMRKGLEQVIHYTSKDDDLSQLHTAQRAIVVTTYNSLSKIINTIDSLGLNLFGLVMEEFGQTDSIWDLMEDQAKSNFYKLEAAVTRAEYVLINDATAVQANYQWLQSLRGDEIAIVGHCETVYSKPPMLIRPAHRTHAINDILRWVAGGKRIAVACESKGVMWDVYNVIQERYPEIPMLIVYNPSRDDIRIDQAESAAFNQNPDAELSRYQVVLYTTKMGAGVSVTSSVDAVFVLFNFNVLAPTDIVQMVARFRNTPAVYGYLLPTDKRIGSVEDKVDVQLAIEQAQAARFNDEFSDRDLIGHTFEEYIAAGKRRKAHAQAIGLPVFLEALQRNGYNPEVMFGSFEPVEAIKTILDIQREGWKQMVNDQFSLVPLVPRSDDYRSDRTRELATNLSPEQAVIAAYKYDRYTQIPASEGNVESLLIQLDNGREQRRTMDRAVDASQRQKIVERVGRAKSRGITNKQRREFMDVVDRLMLFMSISYVFPTPDGKCEWDNWPDFLNWAVERGAIYDRLKGSKQRDFAYLMGGSNDEDKAYKILKAFAQFGGFKIRKVLVRIGDDRVRIPEIENLQEALANARGRKYHRDTDYKLLQDGSMPTIPDEYDPEFPVSWSDVFASIVKEFGGMKEVVESIKLDGAREFSERVYAYVEAGYQWDIAHVKASDDMEGLYGTFAPPATLALVEAF
ncbi:MAG: hypothetical protein LCI00_02190 [Chloroflexi bacterium]|nr:hypothetical protein [Chloroflexota bacterium]